MFNCFSLLSQLHLSMINIFKLFVFFVSALLTSHAVAEVLRGSFQYTFVTYHEFIRLNGPTVTSEDGEVQLKAIGGVHKGGMTVYDSDNELFPNKGAFAVESVVFTEQIGSDVNIKGRIRYIDSTGNQWHAIIRRNKGTMKDEGASGNGLMLMTGGTGKYLGIKGKCPYNVYYKPGGFMMVPTKCSWILRKSDNS